MEAIPDSDTNLAREKPGKHQTPKIAMPPQNSPEITTNTPDTRVGGSIPSRATSVQKGGEAGKPGKTEPPAWFAASLAVAGAKDALQAHDAGWEKHFAGWENHFIVPLADFMRQRKVGHLRIDLDGDMVGFALVPAGESADVFELVDATDEERYYPLGLFFALGRAIRAAREHDPRRWDSIVEDEAVVEIRARPAGMPGGNYHVLWRARWTLDFDTHDWLLFDEQTGTLEKPLPLSRA